MPYFDYFCCHRNQNFDTRKKTIMVCIISISTCIHAPNFISLATILYETRILTQEKKNKMTCIIYIFPSINFWSFIILSYLLLKISQDPDFQTDERTDRQTEGKPIVHSGETGRGHHLHIHMYSHIKFDKPSCYTFCVIKRSICQNHILTISVAIATKILTKCCN